MRTWLFHCLFCLCGGSFCRWCYDAWDSASDFYRAVWGGGSLALPEKPLGGNHKELFILIKISHWFCTSFPWCFVFVIWLLSLWNTCILKWIAHIGCILCLWCMQTSIETFRDSFCCQKPKNSRKKGIFRGNWASPMWGLMIQPWTSFWCTFYQKFTSTSEIKCKLGT